MEKSLKLLGFALILSSLSIFSSCNKEDVDSGTPSLTLSAETLAVAKGGGNTSFTVTSNRAWTTEITYSSGTDWVALSPATGKGNGTVTVTVLPNTGNDRTATIKVATSTVYEYVQIQQAAGITKTYITVSALRAKGEVTITDDVYMKASLISDQTGGNATSLKNIVASDGDAGIALRLTADAATMTLGTELEFNLKGAVLSKYNGLLQLNNFDITKMSKTGATNVIAPKAITAAQLRTGNYESMYVSVANVQVVSADLSKTIASADAHTSINMESSTGESFTMFSSKYSEFTGVTVPQGSGTLKGIAGVNNGIYQVMPQNRTDFAGLTGTRFTSAAQFAYGTPVLAGALNVGTATTATITLPYSNATAGSAYTLQVAVSGAGAAGLTTPVSVTGTYAAATGNIVFNLAGTPTTSGAVVFTITGTNLTTALTVNGTVTDASASTTFASWTFTAAPTFPMTSSTSSTDASTNATLTLNGFATMPTISYTTSSATIWCASWGVGQSWFMQMTPKSALTAGKVITISFKGYGSNTAPRDFVAEYSADNLTWYQMGSAIVYTATLPADPYVRSYTLTSGASSQIYVRIKNTSTTAINEGTVSSSGNSRLANVVISVQ